LGSKSTQAVEADYIREYLEALKKLACWEQVRATELLNQARGIFLEGKSVKKTHERTPVRIGDLTLFDIGEISEQF